MTQFGLGPVLVKPLAAYWSMIAACCAPELVVVQGVVIDRQGIAIGSQIQPMRIASHGNIMAVRGRKIQMIELGLANVAVHRTGATESNHVEF